jgi:large subunit ribosomal protein L24
MKIRKNDTVIILSGKDKGKTGKVLSVILDDGRVIVEGVNVATKHMKKTGTTPGQIVKMEKAIDSSNVALECPITKKATRIGFVQIEEKGISKKFRYSKRAVKENKKSPQDCIIK